MNIIDRLFGRKKISELDMPHIWGIWAPVWLHQAFKDLAQALQLPLSFLVTHVLREWLSENFEVLMEDAEERAKYRQYLIRKDPEKSEEYMR